MEQNTTSIRRNKMENITETFIFDEEVFYAYRNKTTKMYLQDFYYEVISGGERVYTAYDTFTALYAYNDTKELMVKLKKDPRYSHTLKDYELVKITSQKIIKFNVVVEE
jgi:hypothetical protein